MRAMTCPQFDAGGRHRSVTENTAHGCLNEALADIRLRGVSTAHSPEPRDRDRGPSGAVTETRQRAPDKPERPSVLQMTASALTAVSATALLSFVGVWGTVLGMGLLSILTVLGNYMYSSFIHRTAEKVKEVGPVVVRAHRTREFGATDLPVPDATRVDLEPITAEHVNAVEDDTVQDTQFDDDDDDRPVGRLRAAWDAMVERYGIRRIVLSIVAVFVLLAGTVTAIELLAGKPMADIVRNESGSGTSVFGGSTSSGSDTDDSEDSDRPSGPDDDTDQQDREDGGTQGEDSPGDEQQRDEPPADDSPDEDSSDEDSSTEDPSSENPPAEDPPAEDPPQDEPEDEQPPADEQQLNEPPADEQLQQDAPPAE